MTAKPVPKTFLNSPLFYACVGGLLAMQVGIQCFFVTGLSLTASEWVQIALTSLLVAAGAYLFFDSPLRTREKKGVLGLVMITAALAATGILGYISRDAKQSASAQRIAEAQHHMTLLKDPTLASERVREIYEKSSDMVEVTLALLLHPSTPADIIERVAKTPTGVKSAFFILSHPNVNCGTVVTLQKDLGAKAKESETKLIEEKKGKLCGTDEKPAGA